MGNEVCGGSVRRLRRCSVTHWKHYAAVVRCSLPHTPYRAGAPLRGTHPLGGKASLEGEKRITDAREISVVRRLGKHFPGGTVTRGNTGFCGVHLIYNQKAAFQKSL